MQRLKADALTYRLVQLASTTIFVAGLHYSRAVVAPLLIAALLGFAITPMVSFVERKIRSRKLAVAFTCVMLVATVVSAGWGIVNQTSSLEADLPRYMQNISARVTSVSAGARSLYVRTVGRFSNAVLGVAPRPPMPMTSTPVDDIPAVSMVSAAAATVLDKAVFLGMVLVLTIFMLIGREDIRDRWIKFIGGADIPRATKLVDEASNRVSRYLFALFVSNSMFGIAFSIALAVVGIPQALLWGSLSVFFRFVPFIGGVLSSAPPILISLAVDSSWSAPLWTVGTFLVLDATFSNFVEPTFIGKRTGISSFALLVATIFWTSIWGFIGLILAAPLTVCLVSMGRHIPSLQFLSVLLGEEDALDRPMRLYQRLIARDLPGALRVVQLALADKTKNVRLSDDLLAPACVSAQADNRSGRLTDPELSRFVRQLKTLLAETTELVGDSETAAVVRSGPPVLLIPLTGADRCLAAVLRWALEQEGFPVAIRSSRIRSTPLNASPASESGYSVILIASSRVTAQADLERIIRRPPVPRTDARTIALVWGDDEIVKKLRAKDDRGRGVDVVASVDDATKRILERVEREAAVEAVPVPISGTAS